MRAREPFLSVANLLSLSRLPLGALFAWTLSEPLGHLWWPPLAVMALAGITDMLDGWVARRRFARQAAGAAPIPGKLSAGRSLDAAQGASPGPSAAPRIGTPTGTGAWLDPVCDKVFVAAVLGAIWLHFRPPLGWLALILGREIVQLPLSLAYLAAPSLRHWLRYDFRASLPGKAATVMQFAAIAALMFRHPAAQVLALAAFVTGMIAISDYLRRAVRIGRRRLMGAGARLETPAPRGY
jgi:CDP-diacylglycerol---glycerol-3-phosphate 3-phosphatidyltransferase